MMSDALFANKTIVHIIPGLYDGGAEGVLYRLIMADHGNRHIVVSFVDGGKYRELLLDAGIEVHSLSLELGKMSLSAFRRLRAIIKIAEPDVVQTWMYHADLTGGLAAYSCGVDNIVWGIRRTSLEKQDVKRSTRLVAQLCALLSRMIPRAIVVNSMAAMQSHEAFGYCAAKMRYVPNGYDLSQYFIDPKARDDLREQLGLGPRDICLGNVGRYHDAKDHRTLLAALRLCKERGLQFKLLLVGTGMDHENKDLGAMISANGLDENVLLMGRRTDVPAIMNALDLFVLSSKTEGFPNVLCEAMACGTAIVTTDVGDAAVIAGDLGIVCPSQDPASLANGILTQFDQGNSVSRETRRDAIVERYSLDTMISNFKHVWS